MLDTAGSKIWTILLDSVSQCQCEYSKSVGFTVLNKSSSLTPKSFFKDNMGIKKDSIFLELQGNAHKITITGRAKRKEC